METFFYTLLFIYGIMFWSFSSVIIYRFKTWESGILSWRSHCPKCNHTLWAFELIPIISWVKNLWKCKYCKEKIPKIYPLLEISTWILFTLIWYFLIDYNLIFWLDTNELIKLWFWLIVWLLSIIYTFYDILFLEIHDWIMLTWVILAITAIILESFWLLNIIPYFSILSSEIISNNISEIISSIILLIISIISLYIIMLKELNEIIDIVILVFIWFLIYLFNMFFTTNIYLLDFVAINALIWVLIIFLFFFLQIIISKWAWMWGWDLRIAIFIWLILWYSFSIEWLFFSYMAWSIIWILFIIFSKIKKWFKTKLDTQIPFWPFLAIWFFIAIFLQKDIMNLIQIYY